MKHIVFSVFDQKAKAFLPPFFMPTHGMATRVFSDCVNKDDHQFASHPEDYTLFEIGEFDDSNAKITPCSPHNLGVGVQFVSEPADINKPPKLEIKKA